MTRSQRDISEMCQQTLVYQAIVHPVWRGGTPAIFAKSDEIAGQTVRAIMKSVAAVYFMTASWRAFSSPSKSDTADSLIVI